VSGSLTLGTPRSRARLLAPGGSSHQRLLGPPLVDPAAGTRLRLASSKTTVASL